MSQLHSIFLQGKQGKLSKKSVPWAIQNNIGSFKYHHSSLSHHLYDDEDLHAFIKLHFGQEISATYEALVPLAYRADLGRYCLMYVLGGIYSDLSVYFYDGLGPLTEAVVVFRDGFSAAPWIVSNSIIAAPKGAGVFANCIRKIAAHVRDGYYGSTPLCPTGPNLFGRELAITTPLNRITCGEAIRINKDPSTHSFAYLRSNGELIAVNAKKGTGLASLGADVDEKYGQLYAQRRIYRRITAPET